ncbi:dysbindin-A-like isoform X1 [Clinocottus analis]|uniref:dysbindin-A-like isoform X1 n=1 Tax=Clinocottus analis TaxID=304258 RepID=UPI0035C10991
MVGSLSAELSLDHHLSIDYFRVPQLSGNMSASSANLHSKRLPSEAERGQRLPDVDTAQQLKLRERQRFFEEVFQHDVDVYLSSAHLCIRDYKRPPIGSISSMEVNVDLLDQMEQIDISDQETLDVFFSSGGEEGLLTSPLPVQGNNNNNEVISNGLFRHVLEGLDAKSRTSSTSSNSSSDSQTTNANGGDTRIVRSDDEETHTNTVKRRALPPEIESLKSQTPSS